MINLTINNKTVSVPKGSTILEAAKHINIDIPHLCYVEGIHKFGSCRLCVVEVEGTKKLLASCMAEVREGMAVHTNTPKVRKVRKNNYELLLSNHRQDCPSCETNKNCELQDMGIRLGVTEVRFAGKTSGGKVDISASITRDESKCILCRRCVTVCNDIQNVGVINAQNRGFETMVGPAMDLAINTVNCTYCGQCVLVCPTGAIKETDSIEKVWAALSDRNKCVAVLMEPTVNAAIGEEFGYERGTPHKEQLVTCLRELGFADVYDTSFGVDVTVMEQGVELLARIRKSIIGDGSKLPLITSCCPSWVKYAEHTYPNKLEYLSIGKSPDATLGALVKSVFAEKIEVDTKELVVVSVVPCTAKKFEISRPEMKNGGLANIDAVLTTRELARMIKEAGIELRNLDRNEFHQPFNLSSGASKLFGVSGGVAKATLHTVYTMVTGRELPADKLQLTAVEGSNQIKEVELKIKNPIEDYQYLDGFTLKTAVTSGLQGAKFVMDQIVSGKSPYHFIEVMGCPSGCVNGGGQPRPSTPEIVQKRLQNLYQENEPNSQKAQELLHKS